MKVIALCLLGMVAALCAFGAYGEEEPVLLYSQAPEFVAADISSNILVCETRHALIGYDMDSSEERWRYGLKERQRVQSRFNCRDNILLSDSSESYSVLCKATGKIVFEISDNEERSRLAVFSVPGTNWIQSVKVGPKREKEQRVLYSPDGTEQFDVPTYCFLSGFMPDGKTVFGVNTIPAEGKTTEKEVCFWELGSDVIDRSFSIDQDVQGWLIGVIISENTMLCQRRLKDKDIYEFVVVDVLEGNIQRTIPVPEAADYNCMLTPDGTGIVVLSRDEQTVWLLNSTDGTLLSTLNIPGHTFLWETISYDSAGNACIVSKDDENSAWLWAVAPDSVPRKIFDGSRFFPDYIEHFKPPYIMTTTRYDNPLDDTVYYTLLSIFRMESQSICRMAEWPIAGLFFRDWCCSDDMQRYMMLRGGPYKKYRGDTEPAETPDAVVVHEMGKTEPLLEVPNVKPDAMSPDGNHIVVLEGEKTIKIIHVDSGKEVAVLPSAEKIWPRSDAIFSPDGNYFALYQHPYLIVVNLVDGYRQVVMDIPESSRSSHTLPMQFAAEGDRLLSRGEGMAWLHDPKTGELLITFVEPKRFTSKRVYMDDALDFLEGVSNRLVNVAANFTDYAKEPPLLRCAFTSDDRHIVTIADGWLLRVWDASSGKSLNTLEFESPASIELCPNGAYGFIRDKAQLIDIHVAKVIGQYSLSAVPESRFTFSDDSSGIYFWKGEAVYYLPINVNRTQSN